MAITDNNKIAIHELSTITTISRNDLFAIDHPELSDLNNNRFYSGSISWGDIVEPLSPKLSVRNEDTDHITLEAFDPNKDSVQWIKVSDKAPYRRPTSKGLSGMVIVGDNIDVDAKGEISVAVATKDKLGLVRLGEGFKLNDSGILSVDLSNHYTCSFAEYSELCSKGEIKDTIAYCISDDNNYEMKYYQMTLEEYDELSEDEKLNPYHMYFVESLRVTTSVDLYVKPLCTSGVKIAEISTTFQEVEIYAPSVEIQATYNTGTTLATINGVDINTAPIDTYYDATTGVPIAKIDNTTIYSPLSQVQAILNSVYPPGSIYISTTNSLPTSFPGVWKKIQSGYCLWSGDTNLGHTIAPGLPKVTGSVSGLQCGTSGSSHSHSVMTSNDSFQAAGGNASTYRNWYTGKTGDGGTHTHDITGIIEITSDGNSLYGKSTTVQPPAFVVSMWYRES